MAAPKGRPRPAGAGRKKGTPNKSTQNAQEIADKLGFCPLTILAHYAMKNYRALGIEETRTAYNSKGLPYEEDSIPNELAQKAAKDALPYLRPVLKSVELKADVTVQNFTDLVKSIPDEEQGAHVGEPAANG